MYRSGFLRALGGQLQHVAVFENKAILGRYADFLGEPAIAHQVAIFAVDGHEIARPGELKHDLQLFLARVSRDVNLGNFFVHVGAARYR